MSRIGAVLSLAVTLIFSGCATVEHEKQGLALESTLSAYGSALRWGYYEQVLALLHPDQREAVSAAEWASHIRVVGYEVVQPAVMSDEATATQVVRIDYVDEREQRMRRLVDRQTWRWDKESKHWWLGSGLPPFE